MAGDTLDAGRARHADPVDLVRGESIGDVPFHCASCDRLQRFDTPLPIGGVPCAACGGHIGVKDQIEFATIGERLLALAIDVAVLAVAFYIIAGVNAWLFLGYAPQDEQGLPTRGSAVAFVVIIWSLTTTYAVAGEILGVTVGKHFLGIRVVNTWNWKSPGFGVGLVRSAAKVITLATAGIGYVAMTKDREQRALHDRIAGTRVIGVR